MIMKRHSGDNSTGRESEEDWDETQEELDIEEAVKLIRFNCSQDKGHALRLLQAIFGAEDQI